MRKISHGRRSDEPRDGGVGGRARVIYPHLKEGEVVLRMTFLARDDARLLDSLRSMMTEQLRKDDINDPDRPLGRVIFDPDLRKDGAPIFAYFPFRVLQRGDLFPLRVPQLRAIGGKLDVRHSSSLRFMRYPCGNTRRLIILLLN